MNRFHKFIKHLYLRYVWPKEAGEWTPEGQANRILLEKMEIYEGRFEMALHLTGPIRDFAFQMCHILLNNAPNYTESTMEMEVAPKLKQGEPRQRFVLTVQRCRGKTPHQLRRDAEQKNIDLLQDFEIIKDNMRAQDEVISIMESALIEQRADPVWDASKAAETMDAAFAAIAVLKQKYPHGK